MDSHNDEGERTPSADSTGRLELIDLVEVTTPADTAAGAKPRPSVPPPPPVAARAPSAPQAPPTAPMTHAAPALPAAQPAQRVQPASPSAKAAAPPVVERPSVPSPPVAQSSVAPAAQPASAPAPDATREDTVWTALHLRLTREADALATAQPARAALVLSALARLATDLQGDLAVADAALSRAASLAPDARHVALSRRWLAERRARPGEVLSLARAEIPLVGDTRERSALLAQIAAIEEHATGHFDAAEATLREALTLDPQDLGAWEALAALYTRRHKWREAAETYESLGEACEDGALKAAYFTAAANVREVSLEDVQGAQAALLRALEADAASPAAQAALEPILLRARAWVEYARLLVAQGAQVGEPGAARELLERAGDVLWECARDGASAMACYERAAATAPREPGPLERLAALLEGKGKYAELPKVYERLLTIVRDPSQQASVLLRLGALYESRLGRPEEALRAYERALEVFPACAAASQALSALYQSMGRWADLCALELAEAERVADASQRASRYVAVAALYESRLGKSDEAISLYERALSLDATNTAAFDALERTYRARERWDALIALYERLLQSAKDPRRQRATALELAALHHERGGRPERAAQLLKSALGATQDDFPTLVALARAYADAGKWAEYVEVLEQQARLLRDEGDLVGTLYRIGATIEARLDDPRRALLAYQRVLERAPRHEPALRAIARVHLAQGRWEDVVAVERKLLELAPRPEDAAAGLCRIGRIYEERLGRETEAIRAYQEALLRAPGHAPALWALEELLRASGKFGMLADVYERQAGASRDASHKARLLCQAAALWELHASDATRALALYERALGVVPGFEPALWGQVRLREVRGEWPQCEAALSALLRRAEHSGTKLRLLVRLGRVHELRLGAPARAAGLYEEALNSCAQGAALAVDRLRIARAEGKRDAVARWLEQLAHTSKDPRLSLGLSRLRALLAEYGGGTPQEASEAYVSALGYTDGDPQVLEGLMRTTARTEGDARLPQMTRARARAAGDAPTRALLALAAGALFDRAGRAQDAEAAYREALEATPDFLPALDGLCRLRAAAKDWATLASLCERTAAAATHPSNVAEARMQAGEVCAEHLGDAARALASFRALLAEQPGHTRAFARAARLLEGAGDWTALAELIATHVAAVDDEAVRVKLLATRAAILADRLGDARGATMDIERALALRPQDPGLLGALARLYEREQRWQDAAQAYERLAHAEGTEPAARREAMLAQAAIWQRVRDLERAASVLDGLLRTESSDRVAAQRLAEVSAQMGDFARARELYASLAREGAMPERARALFALSEVCRVGLNDLQGAHGAAGAALLLAANDPALVPLAEEHFARAEDWGAYTTVAEQALVHAGPSAPGVLALRLSVARIYRERLRAPEAAEAHLRAAIETNPQATEPRVMLAYGLLGGNDHAAVAEFRRVLEIDPVSIAAHRGLLLVCQRVGLSGAAAIMASVVSLLGEGGALVEGALALAVAPQPLAGSLLPDDALQSLVGPTRARFVRRVASLIDPFLHEVFPGGQESLGTLSKLPESYAAASRVRAVAAALGVGTYGLYRGSGREALLVMSDPRALVLGPELLSDAALPRVHFEVARALARAAAQSTVLAVLSQDQVRALLDVATDPSVEGPGYRELRKRLFSAMSRRARKDLERVVEEGGGSVHTELPYWEDEERKRALRAGVVFSRDLRAVAQAVAPEAMAASTLEERRRLLANNPAIVDALRFAASEACWGVHRRIYGQG